MQKIVILSFSMFVLGLDAYVIAGLIPLMQDSFHSSYAELGQAVTVFTLCYALSAPLVSTLMPGKSIRYLLLLSIFIFSLANAATAMASTLTGLMIARAIAGIGAGLFSPLAVATSVVLVDVKKKGKALGMILAGMSSGTVIGVPAGIYIAHYFNWKMTFWLITVLGLFFMSLIAYFIPVVAITMTPSLSSRITMLFNPAVRKTVFVTLLVSISSLGLYTYLGAIIDYIKPAYSLSLYLWAWGVGGIFGSFSIGFIMDKTEQIRGLLAGILVILSLAFILLPSSLSMGFAGLFALFIWGAMGWSSQLPQQHSLLSIDPQNGAITVALNSSANYLGSSIGSALGGFILFIELAPTYLPYCAGLLLIIAFILQLNLMGFSNVAEKNRRTLFSDRGGRNG